MKLLVKSEDTWDISLKNAHKYAKYLKIMKKKNIRESLLKRIKKELSNNKEYLDWFIYNIKENPFFYNNLRFNAKNGDTFRSLDVNGELMLEILEKSKKKDKKTIALINQLKRYNSDEYKKEFFATKKIADNLTYNDIINFLLKDTNEIDKMTEKEQFSIFDNKNTFELIRHFMLNMDYSDRLDIEEYCSLYSISKEDRKKIKENFEKIKYYLDSKFYERKEFEVEREIVDKFEMDENFKKEILDSIPEEFNMIQKLYFIYKRLCQRLTYDEEAYYYAEMDDNYNGHQNKDDFEKSIKSGNIVCTDFAIIYSKFLDYFNIPFRITNYDNDAKKTFSGHMRTTFDYDGMTIIADGVASKNNPDLAYEKEYGTVSSFEPHVNSPDKKKDDFKKQLEIVDEYFEKNKDKYNFKTAIQIYKEEFEDKKCVTVEDKVDLLCSFITKTNMKYADLFDVTKKIRDRLFRSNEGISEFIFTIDKSNKPTFALVLSYNENEDIYQNPRNNKYVILDKEKGKIEITYDELNKGFKEGKYHYTDKTRYLFDIGGRKNEETRDASENKRKSR